MGYYHPNGLDTYRLTSPHLSRAPQYISEYQSTPVYTIKFFSFLPIHSFLLPSLLRSAKPKTTNNKNQLIFALRQCPVYNL